MRTIETTVYKFDELNENAKQKALQQFYDLNVSHDWWDYTYDDAKNVGIKITAFDLDRRKSCDGEFYDNAEAVAQKITEEHGENCETYKTAKAFLLEMEAMEERAKTDYENYKIKNPIEEEREYSDFNSYFDYEWENETEDAKEDFKKSIFEDYANMLQNEYEYLTSEAAIIESIEANEYEFTEDGKRI